MIRKIILINTNNRVLKELLATGLEQKLIMSGVLNGAALTKDTTLNHYSINEVIGYPIFEIAVWREREQLELIRIVKSILRNRVESMLRKIDEFNFLTNDSIDLSSLEKFKITSESQRWKHRIEELIKELLSRRFCMYGVSKISFFKIEEWEGIAESELDNSFVLDTEESSDFYLLCLEKIVIEKEKKQQIQTSSNRETAIKENIKSSDNLVVGRNKKEISIKKGWTKRKIALWCYYRYISDDNNLVIINLDSRKEKITLDRGYVKHACEILEEKFGFSNKALADYFSEGQKSIHSIKNRLNRLKQLDNSSYDDFIFVIQKLSNYIDARSVAEKELKLLKSRCLIKFWEKK